MGRAYSAGNLSFEFTGEASGALNAIKNVIESLKSLQTQTKNIDFSNLGKASEQLSQLLSAFKLVDENSINNVGKISTILKTLSNSISKIDFEKSSKGLYSLSATIKRIAPMLSKASSSLSSLSDLAKTINSIARLPKVFDSINDIDFGKLEDSFNKATKAVKPFLTEVEKAKDALMAMSNIINKLGIDKTGRKGGLFGRLFGTGNGFNFSTAFSITSTIYLAKRLGTVVGKIVQQGSNYTETLNKWQVAMSKNVDYAEEFVNKMNKAYGISRETLMNAQSTFKNMIGSLGQISEETAYNLSKGITQMAIDYSSLYNVQLSTAFSKFQAMLAGQVRPIRTDSGYDITETTLFQLYQSLGGEKSMRQLTRTEKQLLSVLSVFKQMDRSGALGDMSKTITNFANQSRMMAENLKEVATWIGISVTYLLEKYEVLNYINGILIAMADVAKQFAYSLGYTDPDFGLGWSENVENTSLALDELNGKLLGFDKFRALQGSGDTNLAIDKVLENAIAGYTNGLIKAESPAKEFANKIEEAFGGIENITKTIKGLIPVLGNFIGMLIVLGTSKAIAKIPALFTSMATPMGKLQLVILAIGAIIQLVIMAVKAFKEGDYVTGIFAVALGVTLVTALAAALVGFENFAGGLTRIIVGFKNTIGSVSLLVMSLVVLGAGIMKFIQNFDKLKESGQVWVAIISSIVAAVIALGVALAATKNWTLAFAAAAAIGGAVLYATSQVPDFERGGVIPASKTDSGTIFRAGENGKVEAVYSAPNGDTNIANVQQMKAAFYGALVDYGKAYGGANGETIIYIGEEPVFNAVQRSASKKGLAFAKKG